MRFVLLLVIVFLTACGNTPSSTVTAQKKPTEFTFTPGQYLAYIELNKEVPATDQYVKRLDRLVSQTAIKYRQPADSILDAVAVCMNHFAKHEVKITTEEFFSSLDGLILPEGSSFEQEAWLLAQKYARAGR